MTMEYAYTFSLYSSYERTITPQNNYFSVFLPQTHYQTFPYNSLLLFLVISLLKSSLWQVLSSYLFATSCISLCISASSYSFSILRRRANKTLHSITATHLATHSNVRVFKSYYFAKESKRGSKGYAKATTKALLARVLWYGK